MNLTAEYRRLTKSKAIAVKKSIFISKTSVGLLSVAAINLKELKKEIEELKGNKDFLKSRWSILEILCDTSARGNQTTPTRSISRTPAIPTPAHNHDDDDDQDTAILPNMLQLINAENDQMEQELLDSLDIVQETTQQIYMVQEMQDSLAVHLAAQQDTIDLIANHADQSGAAVLQGVSHLRKTEEYYGQPKYWVFYLFLGLSLALLSVDLLF